MSNINFLVYESLNTNNIDPLNIPFKKINNVPDGINRKSSPPDSLENSPVNNSINRKTIRQSGQNLSPEQNVSKKNIVANLKNLQGK